jgi:hypothetical protein
MNYGRRNNENGGSFGNAEQMRPRTNKSNAQDI